MHGKRSQELSLRIFCKIWRVDYRKCGNKFDNFVTFTRNKLWLLFDEIRRVENENMFEIKPKISLKWNTNDKRNVFPDECRVGNLHCHNINGKLPHSLQGKPVVKRGKPVVCGSVRPRAWAAAKIPKNPSSKYGSAISPDEFIDKCLWVTFSQCNPTNIQQEFLGQQQTPKIMTLLKYQSMKPNWTRYRRNRTKISFLKIIEDSW